MPKLAAGNAIRVFAQAPGALFGNLLDGRLRQSVYRGRHAAVVADLARTSLEFLDPLREGQIKRLGFGEFRL